MGSEIKLNFKCPVCGTAKKDLEELRKEVMDAYNAWRETPSPCVPYDREWTAMYRLKKVATKED